MRRPGIFFRCHSRRCMTWWADHLWVNRGLLPARVLSVPIPSKASPQGRPTGSAWHCTENRAEAALLDPQTVVQRVPERTTVLRAMQTRPLLLFRRARHSRVTRPGVPFAQAQCCLAGGSCFGSRLGRAGFGRCGRHVQEGQAASCGWSSSAARCEPRIEQAWRSGDRAPRTTGQPLVLSRPFAGVRVRGSFTAWIRCKYPSRRRIHPGRSSNTFAVVFFLVMM